MSSPPDYIGATEAARRIGVDRSTLTRWLQNGQITAAGQLGRAYMFDPNEVERARVAYQAGTLATEPEKSGPVARSRVP